MTGYVVLANLGADIDVGTQVANKLNIVPATTGVFGKMRFATAAEIAASAAGPVLDASQAVGVSNNQTISGLKVFASLSTAVPASLSGTVLQVAGSATNVRVLVDAVGGSAQGSLTFRTAAGTQAAPAALAAGASLGVIQNYGYGATGYSSGKQSVSQIRYGRGLDRHGPGRERHNQRYRSWYRHLVRRTDDIRHRNTYRDGVAGARRQWLQPSHDRVHHRDLEAACRRNRHARAFRWQPGVGG